MAELTNLETKLAEVAGLAMAAKAATTGVRKLVQDPELRRMLERMHAEAQETESRCTELASGFEGKKTAMLDEARATKSKAAEMMSVYLDEDADGLDGFEFLTMAEAGEAGHWSVLNRLNAAAGNPDVRRLVEWALPIQERHFEEARKASLRLAEQEDPDEVA